MEIRDRVAEKIDVPAAFFNFANVNLYWADKKSRLGMHQDQDHRSPIESGPLTATVTLMPPDCNKFRRYVFAPNDRSHPIYEILVHPGSLNLLGRLNNQQGKHGIPEQRGSCARLSINFRHVPVAAPAFVPAPRSRSRSRRSFRSLRPGRSFDLTE